MNVIASAIVFVTANSERKDGKVMVLIMVLINNDLGHSLAQSKISELKAFADHKLNSNENSLVRKDRKYCRKSKNAGYQHFLLFPQDF